MSEQRPLPCRRCGLPTVEPSCVCRECRDQTLRELQQQEARGIKPEILERREYR